MSARHANEKASGAPRNAARGVSAADVRKAVASLRRRHRQGRALAKQFAVTKDGKPLEPGGGPKRAERYASPGAAAFASLAREVNAPAAELLARRRFFATYSREELARLCDRRTPEGLPLAWGVVRALLRIPDRSERSRVEALAALKGLSAARVRSLATGGRPAAAGRKVKPPESPEAGLAAAAADARRLKRFLEALSSEDGGVLRKGSRRPRAARRGPAADHLKAELPAWKRAELATAAEVSLGELAAAIEAARRAIRAFADRQAERTAREGKGDRAAVPGTDAADPLPRGDRRLPPSDRI